MATTKNAKKSGGNDLFKALFGKDVYERPVVKKATAKKAKAKPVAKKATAKKPAKKATAKKEGPRPTTKALVAKKAAMKKLAMKKAKAKRPVRKMAKKVVARKPARKAKLNLKPLRKTFSKSALMLELAEHAGIEKKQAILLMSHLNHLALTSVTKGGAGQFTIPGLCKIKRRIIKARKIKAIAKGTMMFSMRTKKQEPHPGRRAGIKPATVKVRILPLSLPKRAVLGL